MNVVLLQMDIAWAQPETNIERAERLMQGQTADLIVLPEMWATGFAVRPKGIAENEEDSLALAWMRTTAKERQCAIAGSLAVCAADGTMRNRLYFITPDEEHYYDKHHLFSYGHEHEAYTAGQTHQIVAWQGFRFLLLTCYDLRFPVWSRYGLAGEYDAILCVANWPAARWEAWDTLTKARAIENQCYVVAVNRVGDDPVGHYQGDSRVIDPIGRVTAEGKKNAELAISGKLCMEELQKRRSHFRVLADRDLCALTDREGGYIK